MLSIPIFHYIWFGTDLRFLQDADQDWLVHEQGWVLQTIEHFLAQLEQFELRVTQRASYNLQQFKEDLARSKADHRLTADEARKLRGIMGTLRETLLAEATGNVAFVVTEKRIDVTKLLSDVRALMAPGVFDSLPDIAQYDFIQAGRCIAFELPTAAAFHILRATEDVLRHFYCHTVRRSRADLMWGPMVDSLRKRRRPPPAPLLDNLDNIRRSFRNPTQHPDKIYDIQEVQDLFSLCIDVVNRMVALL